MANQWWQDLEKQLEHQLDNFLKDHPSQRQRLEQEEWSERQRRRQARLVEITGQASSQRNRLLQLSAEISEWRQRVERARQAGEQQLAERAEAHVSQLMGQGRDGWKALAALGSEDQQLREELAGDRMPPPASTATTGSDQDLQQAWQRFEAEQELENLRRQQH